MGRLKALYALPLLAACAPLLPTPLLPYPGGFAQGGLVSGRFQVVLPGPPLFLDAGESALYAAYPYQLWVYEGGSLQSLPLPGVPRFLRASPRPVVGLEGAVWTEKGLYPYPAQDALLGEDGLYHVDGKGLYREGVLLARGNFRQVVAWEGQVVALGDQALFYPEGASSPFPTPPARPKEGPAGWWPFWTGSIWCAPKVRPLAEAQDFAAFGEAIYLAPQGAVRSCKEAAWP